MNLQALKDSFYIALRDRLAALNPGRVVTVQGVVRPAVVVRENEIVDAAANVPDTFYIEFGAIALDTLSPLVSVRATIHYAVEGSDALAYQDRGRALAGSDAELLAICAPGRAPLKDYMQSPAVALGGTLFWSAPALGEVNAEGHRLGRKATLTIFAFAEPVTSALRGAMTVPPGAPGWRAYFAPVARATGTPAIFDPARDGGFALATPPAPWIAAGFVTGFERSSGTKVAALRSSPRGAPVAQYRAQLDARLRFRFTAWGKLQAALSGGSQSLNLLAEPGTATPGASGGTAAPAVPVLAGSSAIEVVVGSANIGAFSAGDLIAVDADYAGQTGYVGSGIAAAYVRASADVQGDPDFTRRVTFNVARVAAKTTTSLVLAQPLLAGAPSAAMRVQRAIGFVDREGGSFLPEWSALFVLEGETGARVLLHYPRVQPAAPAAESAADLALTPALALDVNLIALPVRDPNDNEEVLCYRSFLPAANAALY